MNYYIRVMIYNYLYYSWLLLRVGQIVETTCAINFSSKWLQPLNFVPFVDREFKLDSSAIDNTIKIKNWGLNVPTRSNQNFRLRAPSIKNWPVELKSNLVEKVAIYAYYYPERQIISNT